MDPKERRTEKERNDYFVHRRESNAYQSVFGGFRQPNQRMFCQKLSPKMKQWKCVSSIFSGLKNQKSKQPLISSRQIDSPWEHLAKEVLTGEFFFFLNGFIVVSWEL